jgi:hypothetical protein
MGTIIQGLINDRDVLKKIQFCIRKTFDWVPTTVLARIKAAA